MKRSQSWLQNQKISLKIYEELCDLKGIHPHGGNQRCEVCRTRTDFRQKSQGVYSWTLFCKECGFQISPVSTTIFRNTNIHLSVWLKALYILKNKPETFNKDLAIKLGVAETSSRRMRRKISGLRNDAFELLLLRRVSKYIESEYYSIFSEHPHRENPNNGFKSQSIPVPWRSFEHRALKK